MNRYSVLRAIAQTPAISVGLNIDFVSRKLNLLPARLDDALESFVAITMDAGEAMKVWNRAALQPLDDGDEDQRRATTTSEIAI